MKSATVDSSSAKTHAALFNTWFPSEELPIPPAIKLDIIHIAAEVSDEMLQAFNQSVFLAVLQGLTVPKLLPFYNGLVQSNNPAIHAFVTTPGGYSWLSIEQQLSLLSFFFAGDYSAVTAQFAMQIREAYLAGIWDLPLAAPLTEIQVPPVFIQNPDLYAKRYAPQISPSRLYYNPATKTIQHQDGAIDYLVIGSGPGGATVC